MTKEASEPMYHKHARHRCLVGSNTPETPTPSFLSRVQTHVLLLLYPPQQAALEGEIGRLKNSIKHLVSSNTELKEAFLVDQDPVFKSSLQVRQQTRAYIRKLSLNMRTMLHSFAAGSVHMHRQIANPALHLILTSADTLAPA